MARFAELHLRQNIGTDVAVLNGMINIIIEEGLFDREYVENRTEGFEQLKALVSRYSPRVVEKFSVIDRHDLEKAARMYAAADKAMIVYAMGITQHTTGTDNVKSCASLAMLT
ncbi:MAG: molybdopterin-dependent oxidoreductase, partial [Deltaproteobacteria bacterium]|nr:molybdopterin-dependent oxidoreductase [Deltaproteobacteria bacterium]